MSMSSITSILLSPKENCHLQNWISRMSCREVLKAREYISQISLFNVCKFHQEYMNKDVFIFLLCRLFQIGHSLSQKCIQKELSQTGELPENDENALMTYTYTYGESLFPPARIWSNITLQYKCNYWYGDFCWNILDRLWLCNYKMGQNSITYNNKALPACHKISPPQKKYLDKAFKNV